MNQMIKHYYFNNTNHGGSLGNGGKDEDGKYSKRVGSGDHCLPLMRLCQRNIMWKLGLGDAYFLNRESQNSNSEYLPMVYNDTKEDLNNNVYETTDGHMFGYL